MRTNGAWLGAVRLLGQAGAAPVEIGDVNFSQALSAPKAAVMFYSPNCPYSRAFLPIFQALGPQTPGVFFATVNLDQSVQNAGKYNVHMLPTIVFLAAGKEVGRIDGAQEQSDFLQTMAQSFGGAAPAGAAPTAAPAPASGGAAIQAASTAGCPVVTTSSPLTPILWGVGAAAVTAGLGAGAYFLFLRK